MQPSLRFIQIAMLAALILLLVLLSGYQIARPQGVNLTIFCLQALPLIIVLPGISKLQRRGFQWCGFIILLYFVRSVILVMSPTVQWIDITLLLLTLAIFSLSLMGSRQLAYKSTYAH